MAVVSSAATNDTGMLNKNGMTSRKMRPMPGPLELTMPSSPKGPPVV